ncbi:MAG: hypothetical protein IPJ77_11305 [Planctomycetes bacterium]|nr:hypothetical protein [Planctomycetota bacterium]
MALERGCDRRPLDVRVPAVHGRVLDDVRQRRLEDAVEEHAEVRDVDLAIHVRPVLPRGLAVVDRPVVAGVVDAIGRVRGPEARLGPRHEPREVVGTGRIAAHQPVPISEEPNVPANSHGDLRNVPGTRIIHHPRGRLRGFEFAQEFVDVGRVEADAFERVLGPQRLQQLSQRAVIPGGELVRPVVGDLVRGGVELATPEPHHRDRRELQRERRLVARVPRDDLARGLHDQGLLPRKRRRDAATWGTASSLSLGFAGFGNTWLIGTHSIWRLVLSMVQGLLPALAGSCEALDGGARLGRLERCLGLA